MFGEDSRYANQKVIKVQTGEGRTVAAITLRALRVLKGLPYTVKQNDRLDLIAYRQYKKPQRFWYVADANTELEAGNLAKEPLRDIYLPET
jgi:hypothetical protein